MIGSIYGWRLQNKFGEKTEIKGWNILAVESL